MRKSKYSIFVILSFLVASCLFSCSKESIYNIFPDDKDTTIVNPTDTTTIDPAVNDTTQNDTIANDTIGNDTIPGTGGEDTGGGSGDDSGGTTGGSDNGGGGNSGGDTGGGNSGGDSGGGNSGGGTSGGGGSSGGGGTSGGGTGDTTGADYTILYTEHYSYSEIIANMKTASKNYSSDGTAKFEALWKALELSVASISKNEKKITKIAMRYPSVNAQGKKTYLSGAVYVHYGAQMVNEIVVSSHFTMACTKEVPSTRGSDAMEAFLCIKNENVMVVASDYLGFGESESYVHPYLNEDLAARNQLDLLRQAKNYLATHNIALTSAANGLKTYSTGYSQGGAVAMAVHKAFDANSSLTQEFGFKQSFCGDGPYDPLATLSYYISTGVVEMPFVLPMVLAGMEASHPELFKGINMNDYFSAKLQRIDVLNLVKSKKYTAAALNEVIEKAAGGDSVQFIMSKKAMNMNSDIMVKLKTALEKNNLADGSWSPKHKLLLHHSKNDQLVPYINYENCMKKFPSSTCINSQTSKNSYQHSVEAIYYYSALLVKNTYKSN